MSEKYKSRKSEPVYSSTYNNGGWSDRDELPTKDPIGDVDEPVDEWVEGYKKWQADQKAYEEKMRPHLKVKEDKVFGMSKSTIMEFEASMNRIAKPECNCGIRAVYGDIPAHNHKDYCDLFKAAKNNV